MRRILWASIAVLVLGAVAEAARPAWRNYGAVNKTSPDGQWQRGYGRMGYGWYSTYGDYVGGDYYSPGLGYRNSASGFNFDRSNGYGWEGRQR